jgi:hypothetical protein
LATTITFHTAAVKMAMSCISAGLACPAMTLVNPGNLYIPERVANGGCPIPSTISHETANLFIATHAVGGIRVGHSASVPSHETADGSLRSHTAAQIAVADGAGICSRQPR